MNRMTREPLPTSGPVATASLALRYRDELGTFTSLGLSVSLHIAIVLLLVTTFFILEFLGIIVSPFDRLSLPQRDIEFVLVNNPEAPPRDPNTKNRSDRMTRSGGEKDPTKPEAEPQQAAGQPKAKTPPRPARPAQKPQKATQPRQASQPAPRPQPKPQPRKAPPAPKMPTPKVASNTPAPAPNPIAPTIRTPMPKSPSAVSGPVVHTPSNTSSGASGGSPGPANIPGRTSVAFSNPASGSTGRGSMGSGPYNQAGSPGGGGGRPGIDALPEPDFGPYIAELQRRIKRNWNPPASDRSKRVVAIFTIGRDGRLLELKIQQGSGVKVADDAALAAVRLSAPFRPLPANYRKQSIDVQFIFDYDVYTGKSSGISRR